MKNFKLCGKGKCCPTVEEVIVNGGKYKITTDDGKFITLTKEQIKILAEKVLEE